MKELPDDMDFLKARIRELQEHTGLLEEEEDEAADDKTEEGTKEGSEDAEPTEEITPEESA